MTDSTPHPHEETPLSSPPADRSLVEDVLLLLFQPQSRTIAGENILFYVLAGAAVTDLALSGRIETRQQRLFSRPVHAVGAARPTDELLAPVWDLVEEKPRGVQTVLASVGPNLRRPTLERLVERGDLRAEQYRALGIFPSTRYALGSERRAELLEKVRSTLIDGVDPDERTAASIALLSASDTLPQFHAEIPWSGTVYTRAKELEQGDWGATAAASAVARTVASIVTNALVTAAVTAART
ncbi:GPP34 family phosphoprotein [Microbacterium sp. ET2]|uniref:GOLPH3/VPS74 family protein n=1 Tax=Microbacterium albipurpureum TaxID=3050384 RepID=UPI00259CB3F1|nr:GPP34 family phosphoprotein [Microbacterium sp. ET2 (Ac-2212)]WJL96619.1 GPP34 family phosphoprotein [Microbacterium sp. ET2 (Ac-2212)]